MNTKNCLQCGSPIKGRIDKKFCDDQCRTTYNNQLQTEPPLVRNINNILRKNRKILDYLIPSEETRKKASRKRLEEKGFSFSYYTHTDVNKAGSTYYYCYDYGYSPIGGDHFMLVKRPRD